MYTTCKGLLIGKDGDTNWLTIALGMMNAPIWIPTNQHTTGKDLEGGFTRLSDARCSQFQLANI